MLGRVHVFFSAVVRGKIILRLLTLWAASCRRESFCDMIWFKRKKQSLHGTAHNKVCGLSWVSEFWRENSTTLQVRGETWILGVNHPFWKPSILYLSSVAFLRFNFLHVIVNDNRTEPAVKASTSQCEASVTLQRLTWLASTSSMWEFNTPWTVKELWILLSPVWEHKCNITL